MIALYILLFIVVLITLLCLVKLRFTANYSDALVLKLSFLFFTITLVPRVKKKKPDKQKKIPKKKKETKTKTKKKPSYIKKLSKKKGVEGLASILVEVAKLIGTTLKGLFVNTVIEKFDISVTIVGDDAADTALKYGKLCGAFYSSVAVICGTAKCEHYNLNVTPDFDDEATQSVHADICFYIRVYYVLKYALKALFKLLQIRFKR